MSSCSRHAAGICLVLAATWASAGEHVVSLGFEADTEDSIAVALVGSVATGADTWVTGSLSHSRSEDRLVDLETVFADLGIDHYFEPFGLRAAAGYWGDSELLDSVDVRVSAYWKIERASLSLDVERRDFDLTIRSLLLPEVRRAEFDANGLGLSARAKLTESLSAYVNGMRYDYSRDISLEPSADVLRIFALSRLSMVNSLIDDRLSGGIEFAIGSRVLDLRAATWRTATFGDRVDSLGIGLLTPLGGASDIELRLETDDSDAAGRATVFSVFLYFYGD